MPQLESKTIIGLLILTAVVVGLTLIGKLTPEAVDILKYIASGFMGVRIAANIAENLPGKSK